ncbi:hypothetical protein Peur_062895 [Populus x canadensis]
MALFYFFLLLLLAGIYRALMIAQKVNRKQQWSKVMGMLEWLIQGRWNTGSDIWQISFAEPINYLQLMTKGHNQTFLAVIHDTRPPYFLCFSHNLRYFQQSNSKINSGSVLYLVPSSPEPNWFTIVQCFYFLGKACCTSSTQVIQF